LGKTWVYYVKIDLPLIDCAAGPKAKRTSKLIYATTKCQPVVKTGKRPRGGGKDRKPFVGTSSEGEGWGGSPFVRGWVRPQGRGKRTGRERVRNKKGPMQLTIPKGSIHSN